VAVILIATVIITYSTIRNSPVPEQPQVLSAVDETSFALRQVLGFTVGYYCSVLQVTGNASYARMLALNYLRSGFVNTVNLHPEWGVSLQVNEAETELHTHWFANKSYSAGILSVTYDLTGLGIYGITYETSCRLTIEAQRSTSGNQAQIVVISDEGIPLTNLGRCHFKFYHYAHTKSSWELIPPDTEPIALANGTYIIDIPQQVDPGAYMVQVEDHRGLIVVASSFSCYTCTLAWDSTTPKDLYPSLSDATLVVELLQNGTIRWLGQDLQLTTKATPFPPIPVKAIHVNHTINGITQEVPFQIEDWASGYRIPLGLTANVSIFNSRTMLVFLVTPDVSKVIIWWNGSDTTVQTPYAYTNLHFTVNTVQRTLTNGKLHLVIDFSKYADVNSFKVKATVGTTTNTAEFMRINHQVAHYGHSEPTYAITSGPVRAIIHHEVEWKGGAPECPNVHAHIVLTMPASATYYNYQLRFMFAESQQDRTITDLCPIELTVPTGQPQTENGTATGYPIIANTTGLFYNCSTSNGVHHWSQFVSGTRGSGLMFTDSADQMLYVFDTISANNTGALNVSNSTDRTIELLPVTMAPVTFTSALDVTWQGAVVTFDGTPPIYQEEDGHKTGLWIIVEYPPTITVTMEN